MPSQPSEHACLKMMAPSPSKNGIDGQCRLWPLSSVALTQQIGSDRSNSGHAVDIAATQMTQAV